MSTPYRKAPTMKLGISTTLVSPVYSTSVRGTVRTVGEASVPPKAPSMFRVLDVKAPLYLGALMVSLAGFCHAVASAVVL